MFYLLFRKIFGFCVVRTRDPFSAQEQNDNINNKRRQRRCLFIAGTVLPVVQPQTTGSFLRPAPKQNIIQQQQATKNEIYPNDEKNIK